MSVDISFGSAFTKQLRNQQALVDKHTYDDYMSSNDYFELIDCDASLPYDSVQLCSYHVQQLMSEIGEVLDADKRWKNFRNEKYDPDAKLDEIADCFIVLMNVAIFSGFNATDVMSAVNAKLDVVSRRIGEVK